MATGDYISTSDVSLHSVLDNYLAALGVSPEDVQTSTPLLTPNQSPCPSPVVTRMNPQNKHTNEIKEINHIAEESGHSQRIFTCGSGIDTGTRIPRSSAYAQISHMVGLYDHSPKMVRNTRSAQTRNLPLAERVNWAGHQHESRRNKNVHCTVESRSFHPGYSDQQSAIGGEFQVGRDLNQGYSHRALKQSEHSIQQAYRSLSTPGGYKRQGSVHPRPSVSDTRTVPAAAHSHNIHSTPAAARETSRTPSLRTMMNKQCTDGHRYAGEGFNRSKPAVSRSAFPHPRFTPEFGSRASTCARTSSADTRRLDAGSPWRAAGIRSMITPRNSTASAGLRSETYLAQAAKPPLEGQDGRKAAIRVGINGESNVGRGLTREMLAGARVDAAAGVEGLGGLDRELRRLARSFALSSGNATGSLLPEADAQHPGPADFPDSFPADLGGFSSIANSGERHARGAGMEMGKAGGLEAHVRLERRGLDEGQWGGRVGRAGRPGWGSSGAVGVCAGIGVLEGGGGDVDADGYGGYGGGDCSASDLDSSERAGTSGFSRVRDGDGGGDGWRTEVGETALHPNGASLLCKPFFPTASGGETQLLSPSALLSAAQPRRSSAAQCAATPHLERGAAA